MLGYICSCMDGYICVRKSDGHMGYAIPQEPSTFFITTESLTGLQLSKQVSLGTLQFRPPRTDIMSFLIPFLRTKHRSSRYVTSTYPLSYLLNPAM